MQRADVLAARLGIRAPEREVHRPADLLVEEDRPDRPVDAEVRADADLAQPPGALVGRERAVEVGLPALGARGDDLAVAELQLDPGDLDPGGRGRDAEAHVPVGRRLVRAGEDLAGGHVALAVGVDPPAALHADLQRRARRLDAQLRRLRHPRDERVLEPAQLAPGRDGVGLVEEQRALDEGAEVDERQARLLGVGLRRPERRGPAALQRLVAHVARALAYRAMSAGSTDVSPRVFAGAWIERVASTRLASSNSNGAMKS